MNQLTPEREKQLRRQKGYLDTINTLVSLKNMTAVQIYKNHCKRKLWSQKEGEELAIKDFENAESKA